MQCGHLVHTILSMKSEMYGTIISVLVHQCTIVIFVTNIFLFLIAEINLSDPEIVTISF